MTVALTPAQKQAKKEAKRLLAATQHGSNAPVRRAAHTPVANVTGTPELHTGDMALGKLPSVDIGMDVDLAAARKTVIEPADATALDKDNLEGLAFAEQGVKIIIAKSQEKNAASTVYCSVNGKGAECWDENRRRWFELAWLPVDRLIIVKRKYVEVLMRARKIDIQTDVGSTNDENPHNRVIRNTQQVNGVSIMGDTNPDMGKVAEWARRIMTESL